MTAPAKQRRPFRFAAVFGIALGLICSALPHDYQAACRAVATICSGGFTP